jgi:hypothetical protein
MWLANIRIGTTLLVTLHLQQQSNETYCTASSAPYVQYSAYALIGQQCYAPLEQCMLLSHALGSAEVLTIFQGKLGKSTLLCAQLA